MNLTSWRTATPGNTDAKKYLGTERKYKHTHIYSHTSINDAHEHAHSDAQSHMSRHEQAHKHTHARRLLVTSVPSRLVTSCLVLPVSLSYLTTYGHHWMKKEKRLDGHKEYFKQYWFLVFLFMFTGYSTLMAGQ